jgi:hypothetical protein
MYILIGTKSRTHTVLYIIAIITYFILINGLKEAKTGGKISDNPGESETGQKNDN